jgi:hypothetical protein
MLRVGEAGLAGQGQHFLRGRESKPAAASCSDQDSLASKSTGTSRSQSGTPKPGSISRFRFQVWGPGWSTSNRELRADLVDENVRRRVDLYVHRPPQGNSHGSAVRSVRPLACRRHDVPAPHGQFSAVRCHAPANARRYQRIYLV